MKGKGTPSALMSISGFRWFVIAIFVAAVGQYSTLFADNTHYKNILVGARAATMGGAYIGISDDAAGSYYNPAGLSYAFGDSLSGSGNAYHSLKTNYKKAIGNKDWDRESSVLLPNFFGLIKKLGSTTLALSYIVPDSMVEHQDQVFNNPNSQVSRFYISLHSTDVTYLLGPSLSYQPNDTFSFGVSLFSQQQDFRRQQNQFLELANGRTDLYYASTKLIEQGYLLKMGFQWIPVEPLTIGFVTGRTMITSSKLQMSSNYKAAGSTDGTFSYQENSTKRKPAVQYSLGTAYYPSPFLIFAADFDYYLAEEDRQQSILNISAGSEIFLNQTNAIRFGYYTNKTNQPAVTSSTVGPYEYLDMAGYTVGYSSYSRTSSITLGAIYATGDGKAFLFDGFNQSRDMKRTSLTYVFAANYTY